jgi:hypothetical protein
VDSLLELGHWGFTTIVLLNPVLLTWNANFVADRRLNMYTIEVGNHKQLIYTPLEDLAEEVAAACTAYMFVNTKVTKNGKLIHEFLAEEL